MERIVKSKDYDYITLSKIMDELCKKYSVLQQFTIGKSCVGRDINAIKINSADEYVLFAAAFHGSEHITSNILLMFLEDFAAAYTHNKCLEGINVKKALGNRGIIFVPCINPDGCEISIHGALGCGKAAGEIYKMCNGDFAHYNANFRGVDINHNFDADWHELRAKERKSGIFGPTPTRFGGFAPHSEPETQAMVNLCKKFDIHHAVAFHSQGEVIYWSYNGYEDKRSKQMAEIMATISGYALDVPVSLATGGGFKDWFLKEFLRPAFTVEVGKGKNPLPICEAHKIYADLREMLTITTIM